MGNSGEHEIDAEAERLRRQELQREAMVSASAPPPQRPPRAQTPTVVFGWCSDCHLFRWVTVAPGVSYRDAYRDRYPVHGLCDECTDRRIILNL